MNSMRSLSFAAALVMLVSVGSLTAEVAQGRADLSAWDRHSTVRLDGSWLFWPRAFPGSSEPRVVAVPGGWNAAEGQPDGWGSYQLTLVLADPPPADFALALPLINSASIVLWNGQTVWTTGQFSPFAEAHRGDRRTGVVPLRTQAGPNVLEVRVSSWGDINAGLTEPLSVGPLAALLTQRGADITFTVFLFGCLFIMGLYHLGLFAYRPQDRTPLWFGFLAILLGLRGLVYGPSALADAAPWIDWEVMMKVGYLTFSASALLFVLFIRDLFPRVAPRWFLPLGVGGSGAYVAANLVLPAAWYTPVLPVFQAYVGVLGLLVVGILIRAALAKERGAGLFLIGFVLFFATVVNDILKTNFFIPTPYLSSLGLLAFLVFQSLVLLRKFTAAFADSERHARHLVRLNSSLERFIPREVLSFLKKDSIVEIELGDHCEQPMSVMFADIRDFTTLSESMSPEDNFKFINSYLRRMGPVVRRHGGFVDKYMGDGIMALFPGPASHAINAALDLRLTLAEYNLHREKSGYPAIRVGIGIHRGPLMLGTIGENQRMDSTVISDTVNAASRLEGLTKKFLKDVLLSGETVDSMGADESARFQLSYLDEETVKGRSRPLKVYAVAAAPA